jgi:hypothetical protein
MAYLTGRGELIARCLDYPKNKFTEAYDRNIGFTNKEAIMCWPVTIHAYYTQGKDEGRSYDPSGSYI